MAVSLSTLIVSSFNNIAPPPHFSPTPSHNAPDFKFCRRSCFHVHRKTVSFSSSPRLPVSLRFHVYGRRNLANYIYSAADKPEISSTAKIRSEVLSPFRSVRMFFYLTFIASGTLGGLIATTQLLGALANSSRADEVPDILKGLGIDFGAVALFAFLYFRENNAKNAQLARLSREESLSNLKLRVDQNKVIPISTLRGIARLVICAGPESFVIEAFKSSEPFTEQLLERGVLVVPLATDVTTLNFEFDEREEVKDITSKRKKLWRLTPVYMTEWSAWLDEQKKLAGVSSDSPVYLSLRMDGRVRGSGVGYPPWNALVAQLPPVKGLWSGLLDGMDGRVL
ncbi:protein LOW PSII ACCUMULATION 1 [Cucumis melo var. makuwa]|uniref:Protein LOW PSII ACCUMULATION 1 n=2 Tax=Cucumis melo TaxID=3656 RepID=A0A5D3BG35_CUCMM|nr:protein LOW PSII ACCUMULATION 1 [Cucumis melo var. makuwa]TYJ98034.1 protein LOW PSII ACCUMULATION 1 [Cucumis melo var. makuwa]